MPRSPSPPYPRRHRDDSPRRYRDDRDHRADYRPRREYRDQGRDYRYRSREWEDRPSREWDDRPREYNDRYPPSRDRSPLREPSKPINSPKKSSVRSGTPEEGQITSPILNTPSLASRLPPKPITTRSTPPPSNYTRRRSPSPPRQWSDRPFRRDWRDDRQGGYRNDRNDRNDRWSDRERDRGRDWDRNRDYRYRKQEGFGSRSPYKRSSSRSSISSRSPSHSSRYTSPRKKSPERDRDSPRKYESPKTMSNPLPPPLIEKKPFIPSRPPPTAPSGPRSDRMPPTGPRALSGGYIRPPIVPPTSISLPKPEAISPIRPVVEDRVNPYKFVNPASGSGPRVSWSERKTIPSPESPPPLVLREEVQQEIVHPEEDKSDVKMIEEVVPNVELSEAQVEERKVYEREMQILMEIQNIPSRYGIAQWEIELDAHYSHIQNLTAQTNKAQSAARIAGAILADAEAERAVMAERRKAAEEMLEKDGRDTMSMLGVTV